MAYETRLRAIQFKVAFILKQYFSDNKIQYQGNTTVIKAENMIELSIPESGTISEVWFNMRLEQQLFG